MRVYIHIQSNGIIAHPLRFFMDHNSSASGEDFLAAFTLKIFISEIPAIIPIPQLDYSIV